MSTSGPSAERTREGETRTLLHPDLRSTVEARPTPERSAWPTVPGYRLVRRLGGGGMGHVYEAIDEKLGVTFALKIVRPDRSTRSYAERFRHEVRAMVDLHHSNIARIYGHGEADGWPYFTMQFLRGGTLSDHVAEIVGRPGKAVDLVIQIAGAVDYLHARGFVHRDLKPSNVLMDEEGKPYLCDFGLVKGVGCVDDEAGEAAASTDDARCSQQETLTKTGAAVGTYAYMSPEQARGDKSAIGPSSDVWSLGVVLFELLVGRRPDDTTSNDNRPPDKSTATAMIGRVPPGAEPKLGQIVAKCLAAEPKDRFPSAAALAQELRAWREADGAGPRVDRRWFVAAVGGAALAGLGGYAYWRPRQRPLDREGDWKDLLAELKEGRAVTVIDGVGRALPFRTLGTVPESAVTTDGWWTVTAGRAVYFEVPESLGLDSVTLTVEVRSLVGGDPPEAGVYAGRSDRAVDVLVEHVFQEDLGSFNPQGAGDAAVRADGPKTKSYRAKSVVRVGGATGHREVRVVAGPLAGETVASPLVHWPVAELTPGVHAPQRTIGLRLRNGEVTALWEGDEFPVPKIGPAAWQHVEAIVAPANVTPKDLAVPNGFGLVVVKGSVGFRNLKVVPGTDR